jgi:hypothetical protein
MAPLQNSSTPKQRHLTVSLSPWDCRADFPRAFTSCDATNDLTWSGNVFGTSHASHNASKEQHKYRERQMSCPMSLRHDA